MTGNQGKKFSVASLAYLVVPFLIVFLWIDASTKGPPAAAARIKTQNANIEMPTQQKLKANYTNTPLPEYKEINRDAVLLQPTESYNQKVWGTQTAQVARWSEDVKNTVQVTGSQVVRTDINQSVGVGVTKEIILKTNTGSPNYTNSPTAGSKNTVITVIKEVTRIVYPTKTPEPTKTKTPTITPTFELIILNTFTPTITVTPTVTLTVFIRPETWKVLFLPIIFR